MSWAPNSSRLLLSTPLELASGWIYGLLPATPLPDSTLAPREALDAALLTALQSGPCYVAFSGGRDSSAILAAATQLARREGLGPPIPVTRLHPDMPSADESQWQHQVINHLGLTEWIRLSFVGNELDLLGPDARVGVQVTGPVWPPALQPQRAMLRQLEPGWLLTGEGGDAVIGARRGTALTLIKRRKRVSGKLATLAATALAPQSLRRALAVHDLRRAGHERWLRPAALAEHVSLLANESLAEPLRYDQGTWFVLRQRYFAALVQNFSAVAGEYGLRTLNPLLEPGFVAALAHAGGRWGYDGRTDTFKVLFSDVLPMPVLLRQSKASFNHVYTGPATREFARTWDGSGVDPELVDVEGLRRVWLSDRPTMATGQLLHSAWLARQSALT